MANPTNSNFNPRKAKRRMAKGHRAKSRGNLGTETPLEQALTIAVASLREGEVVSYGDVAERAGRPEAPRAAGRLLSKSLASLPWWRVVYASGKLAPCNPTLQAERLREEGVEVKNDRVVQSPLGRFSNS